MEEICNLIHTSLDAGKQAGYGILIQTILQSPPLRAFYAFLVMRWISKKLFL